MPMPRSKEEMLERLKAVEAKIATKKVIGPAYGLAKGLSVTLKTMTRRSVTQQYPHVVPDLPARTRGVIAFKEENCTVCMLCSRECPDWCIYIESHKDVVPPKTPGARARTRNVLDRFAIDFALCMYCGICVEVCPFDALFWSPHFEYSELDIESLTHEKDVLSGWMDLVKIPPELEEGAEPEPEREAPMKAYEPVGVAAAAAPAGAPAPARLSPNHFTHQST
jgi:NADH-quinone oxidoreductase subunit I